MIRRLNWILGAALLVLLAAFTVARFEQREQADQEPVKTALKSLGVGKSIEESTSPTGVNPEATRASVTEAQAAPLMVDIAKVSPRRASDAERENYARRLDQDQDLALLAVDLRRRDETGDADAAASLARLYTLCSHQLQAPVVAIKPRHGMAAPPAPPQRCAGLGPPGELTALNLRSSAAAWRRTAAQLGDPVSRLIGDDSFPHYATPETLERQRVAEQLLRDREYRLILDNLYAFTKMTRIDGNHTWRPTLCALIGPCPAQTCPEICANSKFIDASWQQLSPRAQRVALGQQAAILEAIRSGNFDSMWRRLRAKP